MNALMAVVRHELLLQRRQIQTVMMFLTLAVGMGPLGLIAADRWSGVNESTAKAAKTTNELPFSGDPVFAEWVKPSDHLVFVDGPVTTDDTLEGTESYGQVVVTGAKVTLQRSYSVTHATQLEQRVRKVVRRENRRRVNAALTLARQPIPKLQVTLQARDSSRQDGDAAGRVLPGTLLFLLLSMALYVSVDVFTKEKEKGTAETLLTTSVDRRALLLGKALVVVALTVLAGIAWVASLALTEAFGLLDVPNLFTSQVFTAPNIAALLGGVFLLSTLVSGVAIALAAWASSFREASIASLPFLVMMMLPVAFSASPTTALSAFTACLPVTNIALVVRSVMGGELDWGLGLLTLVSSLIYAGLALGTAAWILDRNDPLDKGIDAESRRAGGDFGPDAFVVFAGSLVSFYFFGILAQATHVLGGLAFTMVGVIGGSALVGVRFFGPPLRKTLSLRRPSWRNVLLGVGVGLTLRGVGVVAAVLVSPILAMPDSVVQGMSALTDTPLLWMVLVGGFGPGIFEELLFRGTLLGMLRTRYTLLMSVLISSVMFGFLHTDLVRIVITTPMGVVLALLVARSGSIVPAMLAHTLNNTLAFVEASYANEAQQEMSSLQLATMVGLAVVCVGLLTLVREDVDGRSNSEQ